MVAGVISLYFLATPRNIPNLRRGNSELHTTEKFQWTKHWIVPTEEGL